MWRAAPSAIETGQNSTVTGPQALTRYEYQSVVLLFPSCSMGERPTAREAKTENRVEIFLRGNAKGENEFWTSGRLSGSYPISTAGVAPLLPPVKESAESPA